jgi:hypothetical protein
MHGGLPRAERQPTTNPTPTTPTKPQTKNWSPQQPPTNPQPQRGATKPPSQAAPNNPQHHTKHKPPHPHNPPNTPNPQKQNHPRTGNHQGGAGCPGTPSLRSVARASLAPPGGRETRRVGWGLVRSGGAVGGGGRWGGSMTEPVTGLGGFSWWSLLVARVYPGSRWLW